MYKRVFVLLIGVLMCIVWARCVHLSFYLFPKSIACFRLICCVPNMKYTRILCKKSSEEISDSWSTL